MENIQEAAVRPVLEAVFADLEARNLDSVGQRLAELHDSEVANLLESLPLEPRRIVWDLLPAEREAEVLAHLRDEARASIIDEMDHAEILAAAGAMEVEDLAEVLEELPDDLTETILRSLEDDHRRRLEAVMSFDEDSAGRLMSTDVLSVRPDVSLAVVLRWLRRRKQLPPHTDALMVTTEEGRYLGKLAIADVVTGNPDDLVEQVMQTAADTVRGCDPERKVAALFERRDLISVAVVSEDGLLLGRVTIDDVVDVIREMAEEAMMKAAGLDEEEDLFAPVVDSAKRRAIWLGINLATVFLASWVIGRFEEALDQIVALAVLMPVVASMGGIAGTQTLTLTIRGLALDQIGNSNIRWLTWKEVAVGGLNGMVWAFVVAIAAYLWFDSIGIASVIAAAMLLNLLAAALSGITIPLVLNRMGIDPALSGAVILTTVTDIIGFLSFLGLATLFLL